MTAYKATYLGTVMAVFSTGLMFCFAEQIPTWLTPDPTLRSMIFDTLPLVSSILARFE
jgi:Na+-driven multidrug efflux pump